MSLTSQAIQRGDFFPLPKHDKQKTIICCSFHCNVFRSWPWMDSPAFSNMKLLCSSWSKGPQKILQHLPLLPNHWATSEIATATDRQLESLDSWNTSLAGGYLIEKHSSHIVQLQNGEAGKAPCMAIGFLFTSINSTYQKQNRGQCETDETMEGL